MKSIAFFNNKGGVGKTSLVYHLAWMFAELGNRVVMADLDPQANLTTVTLHEERIVELWEQEPRPTIFSAISPLKRGMGDIAANPPERVTDRIALIPGDLELSGFEDDLSETWPKCLDRDERAFRITTAFSRIIKRAGKTHGAEICLIDVGPSLGAINRAAMIAADYVVIPTAPDLFSVQGLNNVGQRLKRWRNEWQNRHSTKPSDLGFELPTGSMQPIGYVVSRHSVRTGRQVKAFRHWLDKLPRAYCQHVINANSVSNINIDEDENCLAQLKDYRSLMRMAHEARKPMFLLKPGDGAIGGHQAAVSQCYDDFSSLAKKMALEIEL